MVPCCQLIHKVVLWFQCLCIAEWVERNPKGLILAVGDVFPCALAWLAEFAPKKPQPSLPLPFAFVATAKSEFYLRAEDGSFLRRSPQQWGEYAFFSQPPPEITSELTNSAVESLVNYTSVFYPWERALMISGRCKYLKSLPSSSHISSPPETHPGETSSGLWPPETLSLPKCSGKVYLPLLL